MTKFWIKASIVGALGLYLAPAAQAAQRPIAAASLQSATASAPTTQFHMLGDDIIVPLPEGYCEPTGKYVGRAQLMAAADVQNVTHLTLYWCDEMAADAPTRNYAIITSGSHGGPLRAQGPAGRPRRHSTFGAQGGLAG